jgi:hypothetical protein
MFKKIALITTLVVTFLSLATPVQALTCNEIKPINTQFRLAGQQAWISGSELAQLNPQPGQAIDINCFADTGKMLLPDAEIKVKLPDGSSQDVGLNGEARGYVLPQIGRYSVRCNSTTLNWCSNTDAFTTKSVSSPSPKPSVIPTPSASLFPVPTPSPKPSLKPTPLPTHRSSCQDLTVASGNNSLVPAKVILRAKGSDNLGQIQAYKFYFGDGKQAETTNPEIEHTYEASGNFAARVDIKDSRGNWQTSSACEETVRVKAASVESHKSNCSDVFIRTDNSGKAPTNVTFKVTGFDNKGDIKKYKLDFGNGTVKESDGQTFEQRYETTGTYDIKAYILDSQNNWRGGEESCHETLTISSTKPLTQQPATGVPTVMSVIGLASGATSVVAAKLARRRHA